MNTRLVLLAWVSIATTLPLTLGQPAFPAARFSGLMGGDGRVHFEPHYVGHAPVLAGCPQWGWGGPLVQLPIPRPGSMSPYDPHWSNRGDVWTLPTHAVGFYDLGPGLQDPVGVFIRSHTPADVPPGYGETNQNDGWFRFRVLIPAGNTNADLHFSLQLTNRADGRTDYWFGSHFCWDWEGTNTDQILFRPLTRVVDLLGPASPRWSWRNTVSLGEEPAGANTRLPMRRFRIDRLPMALGREVYLEVAQGLPYTLANLQEFWARLSQTVLPAGLALERSDLIWPATSSHSGYMTGLSTFPLQHVDAETNNTFFGLLLRTNTINQPAFAPPLVLITAGVHYEPPGPWVCEGLVQRVIERGYWKNLTFAILPVCNPDAFAWAVTHARPFGTRYVDGESPHATAEAEYEDGQFWWRENQDDVEAVALRRWIASLHARFPDVATILHVDLHSDLCPHPDGWWAGGEARYRSGPPVYGMMWAANGEQLAKGTAFAARVDATPRLGPYLRNPDRWRQLWPTWIDADYGANVQAGIYCVFECDEACLYRDDDPAGVGRPSWLIDPPPAFKRCAATDGYWVDGPIPDPQYYRNFGQDLADAIASYFSPVPPPVVVVQAEGLLQVRWTEGMLQQTTGHGSTMVMRPQRPLYSDNSTNWGRT